MLMQNFTIFLTPCHYYHSGNVSSKQC